MLVSRMMRPTVLRAMRPARTLTSISASRMHVPAVRVPLRATAAYSTQTPEVSFDPHAVTAMDKQKPPAPGEDFRVVILGAGNINFGSDEGPWNHSFRLEHKLGPRLKVVALIDPNGARARQVLKTKCESFVLSAYKDTMVYPTLEDYIRTVTPENRPHVVWVGSPPAFRGRVVKGCDVEMQLMHELPGVPLFIEKPVSTGPVDEAFEVAEALRKSNDIVSVGYMLRYLKVVQKMKQIIVDNKLKVMGINARYIMAYEHTAKLDWWDKSKNPGPIVEQATHFCDLARYFGGDVDLSTVMAHSLEYFEPAGQLSKIPVPEDQIKPENRIPRVTCATWKFESGAVGSLTHAVALQGMCRSTWLTAGTDYSTELDVYADGYQMRLVDPYNSPVLYLRRPGDDHEGTFRLTIH